MVAYTIIRDDFGKKKQNYSGRRVFKRPFRGYVIVALSYVKMKPFYEADLRRAIKLPPSILIDTTKKKASKHHKSVTLPFAMYLQTMTMHPQGLGWGDN